MGGGDVVYKITCQFGGNSQSEGNSPGQYPWIQTLDPCEQIEIITYASCGNEGAFMAHFQGIDCIPTRITCTIGMFKVTTKRVCPIIKNKYQNDVDIKFCSHALWAQPPNKHLKLNCLSHAQYTA